MAHEPLWKYLITRSGVKVKVDTEDFDRINKHSWRVIHNRGQSDKLSVITSLRTSTGLRTMTLGQFILNPEKGLMVHPRRWQNGLDYRKQNLIICTVAERQRMLPKKKSKNCTSQFKGVSLVKKTNLWRARIEIERKQFFLGDFKSEIQAAAAYNKAARELFGPMAYQNRIRFDVSNRDSNHSESENSRETES